MQFRKAKITTRIVESLANGETCADALLPGYFVRRQQDACVYFVRKYARGERHYVTIGEHGVEGWTEARARAKALLVIASLRQGHSPAAERARQRDVPYLSSFAERFLEERCGKLKPTTLAVYRSLLTTHVAPRVTGGQLVRGCLGGFKLDQIRRQHVASLHQKLKGKPRTANHVLAFLSSVYSAAEKAGLVDPQVNPTKRIERFPTSARQRFLTEEELARVGEVLARCERDGSEDPYALAAIRLLIFTGCRRDEILGARWEWVDFERAVLNLPDSKTGAKTVYLSAPAVEVLGALPRVEGNPHIIVGAKRGQRWVNLRKVWVRVRSSADLEAVTGRNGALQQVRLHDLRHSYASLLAAQGASLPMIGKLLGHAQPQTTARYAHLADDPLRKLAADAGSRAAAALRGRPEGK